MPLVCIVCNSQIDGKEIFRNLYRCKRCSFVFAPVPNTEEEIQHLYANPNYFFGGFEGSDYVDYLKEQRALYKNFKHRLEGVLRYSKNPHEKSLFEIGSGYGFFLDVARSKFKEVRGIDISPQGCHYATQKLGLNVQNEDFLRLSLHKQIFDVFCLWDTLEHLAVPHLYIEKISSHMSKDGLLHITTGDIDSWNAKWRGSKWRLIHPPTHLHYFSKKTLTRLLNKYHFELVQVTYPGNYRTLNAFLKGMIHDNRKGKEIISMMNHLNLLDIPIYLNLFDIMHVVARKA